MNIAGGARRVQFAGRCLLWAALGVFGICACMAGLVLFFPSSGLHFALTEFIVLPAIVAIPGGLLYLLGWIIEGFAGSEPERSSPHLAS